MMLVTIHVGILLITAWNIFKADHLGFKWIRGSILKLKEEEVMKYHERVFFGLILMVITGFLLFAPKGVRLLASNAFYIKMIFVGALLLNSFAINRLSKISIKNTFAELSFKQKLPLIISGGVSTISWLGAFIAAFFLFP